MKHGKRLFTVKVEYSDGTNVGYYTARVKSRCPEHAAERAEFCVASRRRDTFNLGQYFAFQIEDSANGMRA